MNTTAQERKTKAIQLLKQLDIYKPYIKGYEENDRFLGRSRTRDRSEDERNRKEV